MKALLQRVTSAAVAVDGQRISAIDAGLLVLLGVVQGDTLEQAQALAAKTVGLRIFADADKPMNRSVVDVSGEILVVSQFTLAADVSRGMRPSFGAAAPPDLAEPLYEAYVAALAGHVRVATGRFGADMKVSLENDGPVTILLER